MFLFKDKLYTQVHGISLGSTLGCTVLNFFLGHLEMLIFKDQISWHPKLYIRYWMMCLPFLTMLTRVRLF